MPYLNHQPMRPLLAAAISLPAGLLWAALTWWISERMYARQNPRQ